MKVIITGANGFLGSELIKKLVSNRIQIIAIDFTFANQKFPEDPLIEKYEMSIARLNCIDKEEIGYVDLFYHFAWKGVNGPEKADPAIQLENISNVIGCAKFAKDLGVKKFLCAGTITERAVESLPILISTSSGMMYGVAKKCAHLMLEAYCKSTGLNFVWMQFANIYGPNNTSGNLMSYALSELRKNRVANFGPANQPYDFIYIDDLIDAVYRIGISNTSKCFYYVGSGHPKLLKEYLYCVGKASGKSELIKIGVNKDDGIRYSFKMFDNSDLVNDIGSYVSLGFKERIKNTIENSKD